MTDHAELVRIQRAAEELIASVLRGNAAELVRSLQPRPEDYAKVFVAGAAARAEQGFAALWANPPNALGQPGQTVVHAFAAEASSLARQDEYSRNFPGGYRKVAHLFTPDLVWVAFTLVAPGERDGTSFDGLVRIDDRWAWFPKPWRVLADEDN